MGSGTHSLHEAPDLLGSVPFSPIQVIDERELDRLAAPRSRVSRSGHAGWTPSLIQGGRCDGTPGAEPREVRSGLDSGGRPLVRTRTVVRIGLVAAIVAMLLVVFSIPRAGADRGPVPTVSHIVRPGDTLWSIAELHTPATDDVRATVALIRSANQASSGFLVVGDVIEVPVGEIPGAVSGASG